MQEKFFNSFLTEKTENHILRIQDTGVSVDIADSIFLSKNGVFRLPAQTNKDLNLFGDIPLIECGDNILELQHDGVKARFPYEKGNLSDNSRFILKNRPDQNIKMSNGILVFISTKGGSILDEINVTFIYKKDVEISKNHQHYIGIFKNPSTCLIKTEQGEISLVYNSEGFTF